MDEQSRTLFECAKSYIEDSGYNINSSQSRPGTFLIMGERLVDSGLQQRILLLVVDDTEDSLSKDHIIHLIKQSRQYNCDQRLALFEIEPTKNAENLIAKYDIKVLDLNNVGYRKPVKKLQIKNPDDPNVRNSNNYWTRRKIFTGTSVVVGGMVGLNLFTAQSTNYFSDTPDSTEASQTGSNGDSCVNPVKLSDVRYDENNWASSADADITVLLQNTAERNAEVNITVRLVDDRRASPFNVHKTVGVPAGEITSSNVVYGSLPNEISPERLSYSDTTIESRCIDSLGEISNDEDTRQQNLEEYQREQEWLQDVYEDALENDDNGDDETDE